MSYPANVSYFLRRLSGFHTNVFKLMPQNTDTASAGKIIQVNLPTNALLNMKSFAFHFDAAATEAGGAGVARLPNKITSLIDRVEVMMGGVTVQQGFKKFPTVFSKSCQQRVQTLPKKVLKTCSNWFQSCFRKRVHQVFKNTSTRVQTSYNKFPKSSSKSLL